MTMSTQAAEYLQGKKVLIVGMGQTGLSCARFLSAFDIDIAVTDSRPEPPCLSVLHQELPGTAVFVGGFDELAFRRADIIVVSPGIALREPLIVEARARGAKVIGDIELFAWFVNVPVVAITGSNGKSTVTTLVGEMFHKAGIKVGVGGNIGNPALDLLKEDNQACVLELSSFQLETTGSLDPVAAALLNISEDHLDRYDTLADYTAAKARIFYGSGVLVVNADDEKVMATARLFSAGRKQISFSLGMPAGEHYGICQQGAKRWLCRGQQMLIAVDDLKITGEHNLANALAALALGEAAGLSPDVMTDTLRDFAGLPHRCQWVGQHNGVIWINDSKATNVGAAIAAIQGIPGEKLILIMGGQGKGQDFSVLHDVVAQRARCVVLIGEDAPLLEEVLGTRVPVKRAGSMREAVNKAAEMAQTNDTVLLSPACASFDMFRGFEHRGETFIESVRSLTQ
ncbi:UDP-N-acetylmuramoyl-L-alanine--D-glutamate ligase [Thiohalophilus thiocyanatoxydans]|uniref:UDP-N-acetylmuramoylalanine--D-glutamate ligase n=1 Tax=Thiohalophilus thiocyanatoxydans TaxID=381308 RepID=A0A4R8IK87_9GAMM|nr:UDP-N-acetylmuramoyl-L-alanine--D-glutamate ligase [Thiohalophilus thiocyanatoxydans]TDY01146.1 UDP-N-acetylmuramoylalanine--D-glutamate ligase [Thiohalophilus thiocyanatoxydans]